MIFEDLQINIDHKQENDYSGVDRIYIVVEKPLNICFITFSICICID